MNLPRRLDKFVREATRKSLTEVRELIRCGAVTWDRPRFNIGRPAAEALVYDSDTILLSGEKLRVPSSHSSYLLNKPPNVTTTADDPRGKRDLREWLLQMEPGTFPVGRLDRATTGALLCTTDGDLTSAILRPDHRTPKMYWLWLNESLNSDDPRLADWIQGVPMLGDFGRATEVEIIRATEDMSELHVTLCEGKNRQIRRMCYAADFRLLHLHRKSIGPVELGHLPLGDFRQLEGAELDTLWISVGGRALVLKKRYQALERKAQQMLAKGTPDAQLEGWLAKHPLSTIRA